MRHTFTLLVLLTGAAAAIGFGVDNRQPLPPDPQPGNWPGGQIESPELAWRAVGRVENKVGKGVGCLIGPDVVLTAKHVVFDAKTGKIYPGLTFTTAENGPRGHVEKAAGLRAYHQGDATTNTGQTDWAMVVLDHSLGNVYGYLGAKTFDPGEDPFAANVTYFGWAANPNETRPQFAKGLAPYSCTGRFLMAVPNNPELMLHDCAAWPGGAGAPLVVMSNGKPWVAAVQLTGLVEAKLPRGVAGKAKGGYLPAVNGSAPGILDYANRCVRLNKAYDSVNELGLKELVKPRYSLSVRNQTSGPLQVAVRYHSENFGEDKASDYVTAAPGTETPVILDRDGLSQPDVLFHAHMADGSRTWPAANPANVQFLVGSESQRRPFVKVHLNASHFILQLGP